MADEKVKEIDQIERDLVDDETIAKINANFKYSEDSSDSEEKDEVIDEDAEEELKEQGLEIYETETKPKEKQLPEENSNTFETEEQETLDSLPDDETEEENSENIKEEPEAEISEKYSIEDEDAENQEETKEITDEEQENTSVIKVKQKKPKTYKQNKVKNQKSKKQEKQKMPEKKPIIVIKPKHNDNDGKKESKNELKQDNKMKSTKKQPKKDIKKTIKAPQKHIKPEKQKNSKAKKSYRGIWWVGFGLIILILLILLAVKYFPADNADTNTEKTDEITATVNGEPIYLSLINEQFDRLAPIMQQIYTKEVLLNQSIDELLLVQEAAKQNITVSDEEINSTVNDFAEQNGLTISELEIKLTEQNITIQYIKETIKKQIITQKFFNQTILKDISISNDEIEKYYEEHSEEYVVPEKVKVQHILRFITDNVTDEQAKTNITEIENMLNATNFCEVVDMYTEDIGSKKTCGEYVFGKGEMVAEFEEASFDMKINETKIVKTIYGYHLIKKLEYFPENKMNLSEVTEEIKQTLHDEKAQLNFEKLMDELRQNAVIVNYLTETTEESIEINNIEEETEIKEPENLDDFAKCLTEKGVALYGASWCPHCSNQKEMFGDSLQYIKYVECADSENPQIQTPECISAKIAGYPTWIINGKQYTGEQTLSELAKLTGCEQ